MKVSVTVKPRARKEEIIQIDARTFRISVKAPPLEGKANEAVERALAEFFGVSPSHVQVVAGHTAKKKIVEILC